MVQLCSLQKQVKAWIIAAIPPTICQTYFDNEQLMREHKKLQKKSVPTHILK